MKQKTNFRQWLPILLGMFLLSVSCTAERGKRMSQEALKKRLTPLQYRVTQENGTEPPFDNKFWDNKKEGIYVDVVSGEPLFSSLDKYKSGTGWPSFTRPINKDNIVQKTDRSHGMVRIEVRSKKGDSHLGHLFPDGPAPTGQRYCINSASLRFIPKESLKKEGYAKFLTLFKRKAEPTTPEKMAKTETATFAAGCFWGVQAIFATVPGVISTKAGYTGGHLQNPTYKQVCTGNTGHAEAVQIIYDPKKVSYEKLLNYFWRMHDPTTLNRQGPDYGTQYRSAIFYHSEKQRKIAEKSKHAFDQSKVFKDKAVTQIVAASSFYPAEEYHQDYFKKKGATCHRLRDK